MDIPMPFVAKFPGRCAACAKVIEQGQYIQEAPGEQRSASRYVHLVCTAPWQPPRPWIRPDAPREPTWMERLRPGTKRCACQHPLASHAGGEACGDCNCIWFHASDVADDASEKG